MTVGELREIVNSIPVSRDDDKVVIQIDSEGNGFHTADGLDTACLFEPHGYNRGEVHQNQFSSDYFDDEESFEEIKGRSESCVVIF